MRLRLPALLALLVLVPVVQTRLDASLGEQRGQRSVLYLDSGQHVRRIVPGFEDLAADLYWLRTIQYYGGQRAFAKQKTFELLRPLIQITTALDPRFELAYRYGAIFMSEPSPHGAGRPDEGIEILMQGVAALPGSWRLRFEIGSAYYFFLQDPERASEALQEGARLPGAPFWMESLAARFLMGQDRGSSREIWQRQAEMSEGYMRENALHHLKLLDSLDVRDAARGLVARYRGEQGRLPGSLHDLVSAGYAGSMPVDASGRPLAYDPKTGRVDIAPGSRYWRSRYD
jgi:hypothetical protein